MQRYLRYRDTMDKSLKRRLSIASCWASSRIALLDSTDRYEDSYAIIQEFREWIICLGSKSNHIDSSLLKVPTSFDEVQRQQNESDEVIEL